ncbi:DUF559 domain-containing protein [Paenibacillus sp. FSL K6-1217]|uniref:endonuclease domain-containing protein n=1 Tax=Paenibacillus sp. FSL K6-1217 TaxID=2921466 RepID=UPI003249886C
MKKTDWNYWKEFYIKRKTDHANFIINKIEAEGLTPIENITFLELKEYTMGFPYMELVVSPQFKIDKYTVDFYIYHEPTDTKIIVECDGHDFHEKTKEQAAHDKTRDRFFTIYGYYLLRYTGSQICSNPEEITQNIDEILVPQIEKLRKLNA